MTTKRIHELLDRCECGHTLSVMLAQKGKKNPIVKKGIQAAMRYTLSVIAICTICAVAIINMWITRTSTVEFFNIELILPLRVIAVAIIAIAIIAERILKNKLSTEISYLRIEVDESEAEAEAS